MTREIAVDVLALESLFVHAYDTGMKVVAQIATSCSDEKLYATLRAACFAGATEVVRQLHAHARSHQRNLALRIERDGGLLVAALCGDCAGTEQYQTAFQLAVLFRITDEFVDAKKCVRVRECLFRSAVAAGDMATIEKCVGAFGITSTDVVASGAWVVACEKRSLAFVAWLCTTFSVNPETLRAGLMVARDPEVRIYVSDALARSHALDKRTLLSTI